MAFFAKFYSCGNVTVCTFHTCDRPKHKRTPAEFEHCYMLEVIQVSRGI